MATLPGLPMFGHGQIEGFTEKYGMEYQRPRYDESPDPWMVERHEREIAPLLKRRRLFAESGNFLLYDFFLDAGKVDENVFAYSNRIGDERALVVYNNRYGQTRGTIDYSAAYADKGSSQLRQQRLREGLGLSEGSDAILAWRDFFTGLGYLRRSNDLSQRGLTLELHAYQCHVFLDWHELHATAEQPWDRLCDRLNGRGVTNLEDALANLGLQPVHDALRALLDSGIVRQFADLAEHPRLARTLAVGVNQEMEAERAKFFGEAWGRCESFLRVVQREYLARAGGGAGDVRPANPGLLGTAFRERLRAAMRIPAVEALFPAPWTAAARRILPSPSPQLTATAMWGPLLGWCALELLAESVGAENPEHIALDIFDRLRLREPFAQAFTALGFEGEEGWRAAARIKVVLLTRAGVGKPHEEPKKGTAATAAQPELAAMDEQVALPPALWSDPDVRWLSGVHEAEGHAYLVRERYEELLWWLLMPSLLRLAGEAAPSRSAVQAMSRTVEEALATAEAASYRVDLLLAPAVAEVEVEEPSAEANSAVEPAAQHAAEIEMPSEAQPLPAEELEPVEPETEADPEPAVKAEAPEEAQLLPVQDQGPAEPESEPAGEPEQAEPVELEIEPIAEPPTKPDTPAEEEVVATEQPEPVELEAGPSAESPTEPEEPAEAQPLQTEDREPAEPESESAAEPEAPEPVELETEPAAESAAEHEEPAEAQSLRTEDREAAELESKSTSELPVGPAPSGQEQPLPAADWEFANPESEALAGLAVEPEVAAEAMPLSAEPHKPVEPESEPAANPAAESKALAEPRPSLVRLWEPEAPRIEIEVDLPAEPRVVSETMPSPAEPWEPAAPKIEFTAKVVTEPPEAAKVLPWITRPWEPVAPKVEFKAKPASEPKAELEASPEASPSPAQRWEPAAPQIEQPKESAGDPPDSAWPPRTQGPEGRG